MTQARMCAYIIHEVAHQLHENGEQITHDVTPRVGSSCPWIYQVDLGFFGELVPSRFGKGKQKYYTGLFST